MRVSHPKTKSSSASHRFRIIVFRRHHSRDLPMAEATTPAIVLCMIEGSRSVQLTPSARRSSLLVDGRLPREGMPSASMTSFSQHESSDVPSSWQRVGFVFQKYIYPISAAMWTVAEPITLAHRFRVLRRGTQGQFIVSEPLRSPCSCPEAAAGSLLRVQVLHLGP